MQGAFIKLASVTYAIRAQKLLGFHGIKSAVKKFSLGLQSNGCGYGVEINTNYRDSAVAILNGAGIRILPDD